MINFMHIAPTQYIKLVPRTYQLALAHLIDAGDKLYTNQMKDSEARGFTKSTTILDNSAYEMYKQNKPMFDGDKLIKIGQTIGSNYIVMPDYPGKPAEVTIRAAEVYGRQFKSAGFKTFFVPQSTIGNFEEYISAFAWAASSPYVNYIGMSILGVPNAYGVIGNHVQRYMSRFTMMNELRKRKLLQLAKQNGKLIHFLGMLDGPREIELMNGFDIDTWDSSAAVWNGILGASFDGSPTGLVCGKIEKEVDFNFPYDVKYEYFIDHNIKYIDRLCLNHKGST